MKNIMSTFEKKVYGAFQIAIARKLRACFGAVIALAFLLVSPASSAYTLDTSASPSPISGLWWNQNESGWGANLIQQYDVIFVTMFTYDGAGNPTWYVASDCAVTGGGCQGYLYEVTGGSMPTETWNGNNKVVTPVGTISLAFADNDNGTMNYTINGAPGSKAITRQVWRTAPPAGSFLLDFEGVRLNSMAFSSASFNRCEATLSFTNISAVAVTPFLYFDVIVGGVTTKQVGFYTTSLAPGATATGTRTVISNSSFPACGAFTLQFNSSASHVSYR